MKIVVIILIFLKIVYANRIRVWNRIPDNFAFDRVESFMKQNKISNCYEFLEEKNYLKLKCFYQNNLYDVDILISPSNDKSVYV